MKGTSESVKRDRAKKGERWAACALSHVMTAKGFSGVVQREADAALYREFWEWMLNRCPKKEADAARLIYCEGVPAAEAATVLGVSHLRAAALASRCCRRLAEMCGRSVEDLRKA